MGQAIHKVGHGLPLFLSFNPFWCTFAVLFAHKNSSTPECTPNYQGEKIRKVLQHIICTHQQSVPLSVDQPVKQIIDTVLGIHKF